VTDTAHFETLCPHCRHSLRVRWEYVDRCVCCKYCEREFIAVKPRAPQEDLATVQAERDRLRRMIGALKSLLEEADGGAQRPAVEQGAAHAAPAAGVWSAEWERGNGFALDASLLAGTRAKHSPLAIPGYEILATLREGAMGQVYKAHQTSLDRIVAVKVLDAGLATSDEYRLRFEREARLAARLSHVHFIRAIDAGVADGHPYYVMEYIEGTSVEDALARQPVFDEAHALRIALAVAEALEHLHALGLMHRDIKPANVILARDGEVKLADLGLARSEGDHELAAFEEGKAIGTPEYISPEQVRGHVEPDIRSDLYSLGATLYRMVTGRVPYAGETSREVMQKHADRAVPLVPPVELTPELSEGANALIVKLLEHDRERRFRDPAELILALLGLLNQNAFQSDGMDLVDMPALPG
jgi:serine/threonine-protein kinase